MNNRDIRPGEMGGAEIMTCCLGQKENILGGALNCLPNTRRRKAVALPL